MCSFKKISYNKLGEVRPWTKICLSLLCSAMSHLAQKRLCMVFCGFVGDLWHADALENEEVVRHIHKRVGRKRKLHAGQGLVFADEWNALVSVGTLIV